MAPPRPPEGGEKTKELPSYNQDLVFVTLENEKGY